MATARDIITRALRARKVLAGGEDATAEELSDGLAHLNEMLAFWATDGINLNHVTLAAGDTLDVPDDHIQTIRLSLAERMTEFGGGLSAEDAIAADKGRSLLRAAYFTIADVSLESPLYRLNLARGD